MKSERSIASSRALPFSAVHGKCRSRAAHATCHQSPRHLSRSNGKEELTKLKGDVVRMNRLVEQLLRVARLDAISLDVSKNTDINEIGRALSRPCSLGAGTGRTIAFRSSEQAAKVKGNAHGA